MSNNNLLKEYIKQLVLKEQDIESSKEDAIFGKYLFGPLQKSKKAQNEPNTPEEDEFRKLLYKHYTGLSTEKLGQQFLNVIKPELEKGNYIKYLAPPSGYVYRGMRLPMNDFIEMIKINKEKLFNIENIGKKYHIIYSGKMIPRESNILLMSWTIEQKVATGFSKGTSKDMGPIRAVFTARTDHPNNNFFVNPTTTIDNFNDSPFTQHTYEKEVISVGPVYFDEVTFWFEP